MTDLSSPPPTHIARLTYYCRYCEQTIVRTFPSLISANHWLDVSMLCETHAYWPSVAAWIDVLDLREIPRPKTVLDT